MIARGRPFRYMITSGFATPGRYLWHGLLADCGMVAIATVCIYWLLISVIGRLGRSDHK
jgi:hypothetical protein